MHLNNLDHILAAGWGKPAVMPQQRTNDLLVAAHQGNQHPADHSGHRSAAVWPQAAAAPRQLYPAE